MPLVKLIADPNRKRADKGIQQTALADDALGRYGCNSWDEIRDQIDGTAPFDVVIIGAGMCGAYCAEKLYRHDWLYRPEKDKRRLRFLVIEEGPFLFPTHVQNPPKVPASRGTYDLVWRTPWTGNEAFIGKKKDDFRGQAFCVGGRSLFWAGWAPRLTREDLAKWPKPARDLLLNGGYARTEREVGADRNTDYIVQADLYRVLFAGMQNARVKNVTGVDEAPLAVLGSPPTPGVFPFDKYSSVTLLLDAVYADVRNSLDDDDFSTRRLMVLPRAHVRRLVRRSDKVVSLDLDIDGRRGTQKLPLKDGCMVVLANGTIEATRLALSDLGVGASTRGRSHVGNFMAHLRSNIFVRIKRSAFTGLPKFKPGMSEVAAFIVRGQSNDRRFHLQVVAAATAEQPESLIWQMVPDTDLLDGLMARQDPNWISIVFRGIGEMEGNRDMGSSAANAWKNWIRLGDEKDEHGLPKADVMLNPSPGDDELWKSMDRAALDLAKELAGGSGNIEYFDGSKPVKDRWGKTELDVDRPKPPWHDGIGTTYHEAGALFMGEKGKSITDANGKFHHLDNV